MFQIDIFIISIMIFTVLVAITALGIHMYDTKAEPNPFIWGLCICAIITSLIWITKTISSY